MKAGAQNKIDATKFKDRATLMTFCQRHPGALTAHFLGQVRQKVKGASGVLTQSKHLRDVDMVSWLQAGGSGVTEKRDLREVLTLATVVDLVNKDNVAQALDVIVMRVQAIQKAKSKGGDWEKASKLELISEPGTEMLPAGLHSPAS